ncbi:hypothetical protein C8R44DRAFT_55801 [Mycena epipterygia]|nr:hypothetical protein C8R44DRAFT_55801 [Mycena epipterygia]
MMELAPHAQCVQDPARRPCTRDANSPDTYDLHGRLALERPDDLLGPPPAHLNKHAARRPLHMSLRRKTFWKEKSLDGSPGERAVRGFRARTTPKRFVFKASPPIAPLPRRNTGGAAFRPRPQAGCYAHPICNLRASHLQSALSPLSGPRRNTLFAAFNPRLERPPSRIVWNTRPTSPPHSPDPKLRALTERIIVGTVKLVVDTYGETSPRPCTPFVCMHVPPGIARP